MDSRLKIQWEALKLNNPSRWVLLIQMDEKVDCARYLPERSIIEISFMGEKLGEIEGLPGPALDLVKKGGLPLVVKSDSEKIFYDVPIKI